MEDITIKIGESFHTDSTQLIFVGREGMHRVIYNFYTGISEILSEGDPYPEDYILKIPNHLVEPLFRSFAETLDKRGIKTPNTHKIEGQLDSTKYHLEDLRKMLKLKK